MRMHMGLMLPTNCLELVHIHRVYYREIMKVDHITFEFHGVRPSLVNIGRGRSSQREIVTQHLPRRCSRHPQFLRSSHGGYFRLPQCTPQGAPHVRNNSHTTQRPKSTIRRKSHHSKAKMAPNGWCKLTCCPKACGVPAHAHCLAPYLLQAMLRPRRLQEDGPSSHGAYCLLLAICAGQEHA